MPHFMRLSLASLIAVSAIGLCAPWQAACAQGSPVISSFKPHKGAVGSTVTINGSQFTPPFSVTFGGGVQAAGSFTSTQITVTVPSGAVSGDITVTTQGGSATTNKPFAVTRKKSVRSSSEVQSLLHGLNGTH